MGRIRGSGPGDPRQGGPPPQRARYPARARPGPVARGRLDLPRPGASLMQAPHQQAAFEQAPLGQARVTVVIATRDRRLELLRTLDRLHRLPERPPVIVVDNASSDGTAPAVGEHCPAVARGGRPDSAGAAARNAGVAGAATPYVAFSDDDSWWDPGALSRAAAALDADPRLGLIAARTLTGPARVPDPVNELMARSPLRDDG